MTKYDDPGVAMVAEFHNAFNCSHAPEPYLPPLKGQASFDVMKGVAFRLLEFAEILKAAAAEQNKPGGDAALALMLIRLQLHVEEGGELAKGIAERDMVQILDALSDISYVTDGTYLTFGLGGLKVQADAEVHRSNMSKLGLDGQPIISDAGRVVKPAHYSPPRFAELLDAHALDLMYFKSFPEDAA